MLNQLNLIFRDITPLFALVGAFFLFGSICFCWQELKKFFSQLNKKTWIILLIIFLVALIIRLVVPVIYHRIYLDEIWYMEASRSIMETGLSGSYVKSIGWPFSIAIAFWLFGVKSSVVFYSSIFLGAATIFPVFFLTCIISAKEKLSLFFTFLFSLFPLHILWSASGETNAAALFFVVWTIFFYFLYFKSEKNSYSLFWLSLASTSFASQFRPEFYALYLLFFFGYFLYKKPLFNFERSDLKLIIPLILLVAISLPNLFVVLNFQLSQNWLMKESAGRLAGSNWSLDNLVKNSVDDGFGLFKNEPAVLLLSIMGVGYLFFKKRKEVLVLSLWFVLLWLIYFSSWMQTLTEKERIYNSFYPMLIIFSLFGFLFLEELLGKLLRRDFYKKTLTIIVLAVVSLLGIHSCSAFFADYSYNQEYILDVAIPHLAEKEIPQNCAIISLPHTALGAVGPYRFIYLESFLNNEVFRNDIFNKNDCVLFFENLYCGWPGYGFIEQCQEIKDRFNGQVFKTYKIESAQNTFYKISK